MDDSIVEIAQKYAAVNDSATVEEEVRSLAVRYHQEREQSLLDAAATAAALSLDPSCITPEVREAVRLAFPHLTVESLIALPQDELAPIMGELKGKLLEVLVRNRLNLHEWVGDLHLAPGEIAAIAEHGVDAADWALRILNLDGALTDRCVSGAMTCCQYLKNALVRHPDLHVAATPETVDHGIAAVHGILEHGGGHALQQHIESGMMPVLDHPAVHSLWHDFIPALPFLVIAVHEGANVLMSRKTLEQAAESAFERGLISAGALSVGWLVHCLDGGIISVPAAMATRIAMSRTMNLRRSERHVHRNLENVREICAA